VQGGKPGTLAEAYLTTADGKRRRLKKEIFVLNKGDLITCILPGAGGWGNPYDREIGKILRDVEKGIVGTEKAESDYGVVINRQTMQVDFEATRKLRERL
jgi:N-methylhydantoinase B